jgi:ferrous iron transport protein B
MEHNLTTAANLGTGEEGVVHAVSGGGALLARLAAMGIASGARIKMLQACGGGSLIVQAGDTRVVLGRGEAGKILVRKDPPSGGAEPECRGLLVALAGQPNVGKSTVFNILTGLSQHVGNWPGKTVERKTGFHRANGVEFEIVDLPGTYSLTALSEEERVARDFVLTERPDVIVLMANATALERSLYLLSEMLLLGRPVILAVNMIDIAESQGIHVDTRALEDSLGIPVVAIVATRNRGIKELLSGIVSLAMSGDRRHPRMPAVSADHGDVFRELSAIVERHRPTPAPTIWTATKLMEGDLEVTETVRCGVPENVWNEIQGMLRRHEDSLHAVVGGRYDWIEVATRAAVSRFKMGQLVMTDRIDHVLTRPVFGVPILLLVMGLVFLCTYTIGFPLQRALQSLIASAGGLIEPTLAEAPAWVRGIVVDGVIGGVGSVASFVPILLIFFAVMAVLEDVGYMARAAFVMDRFMHLIGLHGKSFLPMCLGFGCNVPAILGARIVESRRRRLLTIFLSPFVPCTARLGVLVFVSAAVFGARATLVSASILAANLVVLAVSGIVISRGFFRGESTPFIMELPLYHRPNARTIWIAIWLRTLAFMRRAGTVILAVSVVIWLLSYFPHGDVERSILARIGHALAPLGAPLGLDWRMMTALLTSILAKENGIATLGVLYGVGGGGLSRVLPTVMSPPSALAFLTVLMLFIPCAATGAVMYREMGGRRWFAASMAFMLAVSFLGGLAAYRIGLLIFGG